ncbi:hypothetical protein JXB02_06790 [Candidatus Woesearchaeota archaeon]|nr:hypothetical protein [Candidatus Woesearchaeota archaeon]
MAPHFIVTDIETTGLSRDRHRITEIAAVKVEGSRVRGSFQTLVDPGVPIPRFITRLTGIDDEMVRGAPRIGDALPEFLSFLDDGILVAHNAGFDYGFLSANAERHLDTRLGNDILCTRRLATRLLPDLPSKRLEALCEHFRITNERAHRALADARATTRVFIGFRKQLNDYGLRTAEDLLRFQLLPLASAQRLLEENRREKGER